MRIRRCLGVVSVIRIVKGKHGNGEVAPMLRRHRVYTYAAAFFRCEEDVGDICELRTKISPSNIADRQVGAFEITNFA